MKRILTSSKITAWFEFTGIVGLVLILVGTGLLGIIGTRYSMFTVGHWVVGTLLLLLFIACRLMRLRASLRIFGTQRKQRISSKLYLIQPLAGFISAVGFVFLLLGALAFLQSNKYRWDTTQDGVYSLSEEMSLLLSSIKKPVHVSVVINAAETNQAEVSSLLRLLSMQGGSRLTIDTFDVIKDRVAIKELGLERGEWVHVSSTAPDGREVVSTASVFSEQSLFDCIRTVVMSKTRRVYFIEGHGEPSIVSSAPEGLSRLRDELKSTGIDLVRFLLPGKRAVPSDADAIMLVAPQQALSDTEIEVLKAYEKDGGTLLLFHDPQSSLAVANLAAQFGMTILPAIALDSSVAVSTGSSNNPNPGVSWQLPIKDVGKHGMFLNVSDTATAVFLYASPIVQQGADTAEYRYAPLALTEKSAWAEFDLEGLSAPEPSAEFNAGMDKQGTLSLGMVREYVPVASSKDVQPSKVIVWGDVEWIKNVNIEVYQNLEIALASIEWSTTNGTSARLPKRALRQSIMPITLDTFTKMIGFSALVPELLLLVGLGFWWQRRYRSLEQRRSVCP